MSAAAVPRAGLFVTGTDTGVGKTAVAAGLVRLALRAGLVPVPYKPVETGCDPEPRDARRLREAARSPVPLAEICPFPLALPAAPAAAAAAAGLRLDVVDLARRGLDLAARGDFLIVEGAGGLLAPYDETATNADLAAHLGLPILVVARTALGTINHVALTVAELARRHLPLAGVLLVSLAPEPAPHESSNADLIATVAGTRPLGPMAYLANADTTDPDLLADALARILTPSTLQTLIGQAGGR